MKTEEMRDLFKDRRQAMRMNYYPPCPQPEKVIGLTPHSGSVDLTIRKDGMWVPVKPLPETFVVNIGDILEMNTRVPMYQPQYIPSSRPFTQQPMYHYQPPQAPLAVYPSPPTQAHFAGYTEGFSAGPMSSVPGMIPGGAFSNAPSFSGFAGGSSNASSSVTSPATHPCDGSGGGWSGGGGCGWSGGGGGVAVMVEWWWWWSSGGGADGGVVAIVSNGVYRSIEHRATVNSTKERLSIATFYSSNLDSELGPAHSLVGPDNPAVFRWMPTEEYFKEFFARKLNEVGPASTLSNPQNPPLFQRVGMEEYVKDFFSRKLDGKSFLEQMKGAENGADNTSI
ncbi:hypothetical protein RHGRI_037762 [Rhododendron griersonianum]|uniref:Isopenicillin N synthase-like Fe(2+) 2OG dioxygenase domain-containing protein n=1 Tax=Rhododendron griersonianum TaxID=479676 RepID=A0AAV6HWV5_9ERIC|nr:hypothetical protein RHGRI_037762 [Rhododendron griersonianum]